MGRDERMNPNRPVLGIAGGRPAFGGNIPIIGGTLAPVKDRFNRALQVGDLVLLSPNVEPPPFAVARIERSTVDVQLVDVTLTCQLQFRAAPGEANREFMRVVQSAELKGQGRMQQGQADGPPPVTGDEPLSQMIDDPNPTDPQA